MPGIEDFMKKDVISLAKDDNIMKAASIMTENDISCVVIGRVEGIITRRDVLEKVIVQRKNMETEKICDHMSQPVVKFNVHDDILKAAALMKAKKIKQLPVVDGDKLVGIITQTDIIYNIKKILGFQSK